MVVNRGAVGSQRLMIIGEGDSIPGLSGCGPYEIVSKSGVFEALQQLRDADWDADLLRLPLEGWSGCELLEEVQRAAPGVPCVVLAAPGEDWHQAVQLTKLSAQAWLPATAPVGDLMAAMEQAMTARLDWRSARVPEGEPWRRFLVGTTAAMRHVTDTIRLIGSRRSIVLITGETGTGKEMAARAVHAASTRAHLPMVAVNCSALPENLLEAELFGHLRGAFTGAVQSRTERFEQADKGTIVLDEVAEMPLDL